MKNYGISLNSKLVPNTKLPRLIAKLKNVKLFA